MRLILKTNSNASRASSGWKHQFGATQRLKIKFPRMEIYLCPISLSQHWLTRQKHRNFRARCVYFSLARIFRHAKGTFARLSTISSTISSMLIAYHRARIVVLKFHGWQNAADKNAGIANARYIVDTYTCMYVSAYHAREKRNQVVLEVCSIKYLPIL